MNKIPVFQIDSFSHKLFGGNPAAVCILDNWLDDKLLQNIAMEINLSETAFYVPKSEGLNLRWFTPKHEVRLCGHATLATAHVLFHHLDIRSPVINFQTKGGELKTSKDGIGYQIQFPIDAPQQLDLDNVSKDLGFDFNEAYQGKDDILLILNDQTSVEKAQPNISKIKKLNSRGLIISAEGNDFDFVSRCFYPNYGIDEDPVTGSAHTLLTPYWSKKLNKTELIACQLSSRKGHLQCCLTQNHVCISGQAKTSIIGQIYL